MEGLVAGEPRATLSATSRASVSSGVILHSDSDNLGAMMEEGTEVKSFERDGWRVGVRVTAVTSEGRLCGSADIFQGADHRCRLALHRAFKTTEELVAAHESRAMEWIDEWLRRDHTGTTGFSSL